MEPTPNPTAGALLHIGGGRPRARAGSRARRDSAGLLNVTGCTGRCSKPPCGIAINTHKKGDDYAQDTKAATSEPQ